jgi:hypothetical protein
MDLLDGPGPRILRFVINRTHTIGIASIISAMLAGVTTAVAVQDRPPARSRVAIAHARFLAYFVCDQKTPLSVAVTDARGAAK